jgi:glutathione S-transferase
MELYVTPTSPYARMARIAAIEKGLSDQVKVRIALTRTENSPYYAINPSGRVPCLVRPGGPNLEDSQLICAYFDAIGSGPKLTALLDSADWEYGRLEMLARSYMDGLAVWAREVRRPRSEQSPGIVAHETARARRMADVWEREIGHRLMVGPMNMPQLTLICALGSAARLKGDTLFTARPRLQEWADEMAKRPSVVATEPGVPIG